MRTQISRQESLPHKAMLRPDAVPTIFYHSQGGKNRTTVSSERRTAFKRRRKEIMTELLQPDTPHSFQADAEVEPEASDESQTDPIGNAFNSEQTGTINGLNSERSGTMASHCNMEEGDTAILSGVEIEIDVAEETVSSEQTGTINALNREHSQSGIISTLNSDQSETVNGLNSERSGTMASHCNMEEGDTAILSGVKIEIDVAEETPRCWYMTEPQPYVPVREDVATENTTTMPSVQTVEGNATVNTHSNTWLKQEMHSLETQTKVSTPIETGTSLKQETQTPETQTEVSTCSDTWLKQEIQTPETQTAVNTHSDTWLKQEIQTPETQTAISSDSNIWMEQEIQTPETQTAVNTHSDTWLKQEIQTPETQTAISSDSNIWMEQEIQTPETQTAVNTHSDTWLKQEIQTPETQTAVSSDSSVKYLVKYLAPIPTQSREWALTRYYILCTSSFQ
ncbi:hypothetical protein V1264_009492 [Littorina saxatilis]|uniref:Uncharacterized protein n=3 Tax=Littorina saxatilis TaxID=31220 RepID=A0AAN9ASL7_9CAEN